MAHGVSTSSSSRSGGRGPGLLDPSTLFCSECGRSAPADARELGRWEHGTLLLSGVLDEETAALLLCPDCWRENREHEFEEGSGG